MAIKKSKVLAMEEANVAVLVELIVGANISESLRIQAMDKLISNKEGQNFFKTLFEEKLSFGACPKCEHNNHWLIPEDDLNEMNYVSEKEDTRVPAQTTAETCVTFEQACKKKKVTV